MTQKHENLSALVDGEHADSKLVSDLVSDGELSAKWQRYHLIRQSLRKEMPANVRLDVSASVMAALDEEPTILAPKRRLRDLPLIGSVIPLVRSSGQLAIAASVAVAVVIAYPKFNNEPESQIFNPAPASFSGIQGGLSPVSLEETRIMPSASNVQQHQRRINAHINDHMWQLLLKDSQKFAADTGAEPSIENETQRQPEVSQERENLPE